MDKSSGLIGEGQCSATNRPDSKEKLKMPATYTKNALRRRFVTMAAMLVVTFVLLATAQNLMAATYYVGTCQLGAYSTIQEAVDSVPSGATIKVCPGSYAEQVVISKPLTLKNFVSNGAAQAMITMPATGLSTTSSDGYGTVAAQVQVTSTGVNITGMAVDGTATGGNCPSVTYIGIFYSSGSAGTIDDVATQNHACGQFNGVGIWAENGSGPTQTVTIENSSVSNENFEGIFVSSVPTPPVLDAVIKGNSITVSDQGIVAFGVGGSISGNIISAGGTGINTNSPESKVTGNTVTGAVYGILAGYAPTGSITITGNTLTGSQGDAVLLENGAIVESNHITGAADIGINILTTGATVENNTIVQTPTGIGMVCGGVSNTVTGNTIISASLGLSGVPAGFTGNNNFYNVPTVSTSCQ